MMNLVFDLHRNYSINEMVSFVNNKSIFHKHSISESERYGVGLVLRKSYYYGRKFPIRLFYPHGPSIWNETQSYIIDSSFEFYGFFTKRHREFFNTFNKSKAFHIEHPCVRQLLRSRCSPKTNSAVFFLSHSTAFIELKYNFECLLAKLAGTNYDDIIICLHFIDIQKGYHKYFIDNGFKVVSAGNWENEYFFLNLINIINYCSVVLSNGWGSHVLFSIFLNRRVEYIDVQPLERSGVDTTLRHIELTFSENYLNLSKLFFNNCNDTEHMFELASVELGYSSRGRVTLFFLLYWSLFSFYFSFYKKRFFRKFLR